MSTSYWVCPICGSPNISPADAVGDEVVMICGNTHIWRATLIPRVGVLKVWLVTEADLADFEEGRKPTAIPRPAIRKIRELVEAGGLPQREYVKVYETRVAAYYATVVAVSNLNGAVIWVERRKQTH